MEYLELRPAGDFDKDWQSCSISGAYIIVGVEDGRLYTSSNYGVSWTERRPAGDVTQPWLGCSVSGAHMIAGVDRLYTSSNYGVSWTERRPAGDSDKHWSGCSVDGAYMIATSSYGSIYTSSDYGVSWTERQSTGNAPTITTQAITNITINSATGNGNVTVTGFIRMNYRQCSVDGNYMIAEIYNGRLWRLHYEAENNPDKYGICWNKTGSPTMIDDNSEKEGSFGTGAFTRPIMGLEPETKYYVKAYACNGNGHSYGGEVDFTTKALPSYGIHEESNVATICFYVRRAGGKWSIKHGPYTKDQADIEIGKILTERKGKY